MKVVYHPAVQRDVSAILRYYDALSRRVGDEFWAELQMFVKAAAENPERFHPVTVHLRRANLRRFPYHLLFRQVPGGIRIIAVRHHRQHPDRGLRRK